jgi:energy-coupling factor transport system ATP-binding protein
VLPELAFAMENLGVPRAVMRRRVEEVLDALGIAHLRERRLDTLSGGERQRVAIAAVLTAQPQVLVLDEPTSALDPQSAEDVFSVLGRLRDELGLTIVCAEHRLERVASFTDHVFFFDRGVPLQGTPREVFERSSYTPPVSLIGRRLGWRPLPVTVREGRRFGVGLDLPAPVSASRASGDVAMRTDKVRIAVGGREVVRGVSLEMRRGEIAALLGRNGAGKTTLLRALAGLVKVDGGSVSLGDDVLDGRRAQRDASKRVAYVPQRAEMLLFRDTVGAELPDEDWLRRLGLLDHAHRHPWTLSAGQRLWAALGTAFVRSPDVYLLDEPTRGLDPPGKDRLARILREKTDEGAAVLLVTHDVELVARTADRVHLMAEGDIVASGPVRDVLGESLLFSSQTAKVMGDPHFLVPDDVFRAVAGARIRQETVER